MKKKTSFWLGMIGSFILGALFSLGIAYIFFLPIPQDYVLLSYIKGAAIITLGLPMLLTMWFGSSFLAKSLFCSTYGHSTFGCWSGNSFWISIFVYGSLFALIYYFGFWKKYCQ